MKEYSRAKIGPTNSIEVDTQRRFDHAIAEELDISETRRKCGNGTVPAR